MADVKSHQPIVGGVAVLRVVAVPLAPDDDLALFDLTEQAWRVVGRTRVDFPQGAVANGLLLVDDCGNLATVVWERPREGGAGRFRVLPLGDWS